ncbi:hypothetical protein [Microbispora sp. H10949]|uniref:hypothetical protein n=1 Tax=Microbispora sp. H10949 TaxID=2729111 RepID=UPI0016001362|nr:hypothetical protein [Microbispora sp. H10949]
MNGDGAPRIGFEWALEGKEHGSYDEYGLLQWSNERLAGVFDELRARYAAGTPSELPQVTIAPAATKDNDEVSHNVVLAIHTWSDHRDFAGRKVAYTRWFYVPYHQLQGHPVSYRALYAALGALPPAPEPPLTVAVPALDPRDVMPGADALAAAALLASGQQVCLVGADGVPMAERLRFVDTVMALLPYGLRTRFSAATWTSSTTKHRIKLSFARYAPEGIQAVQWGQGADIPLDKHSATYHRILRKRDVDYPDLIGWLAGQTEPLSFNDADRSRVFELLRQSAFQSPPARPDPVPAPAPAPAASGDHGVVEVAHRGPTVAALAAALAEVAPTEDARPTLTALLEVVWNQSDRSALADALYRYRCFRHVIDQQEDRDHLYERLVSAAFQPDEEWMWASKRGALLAAEDTPDPVRRRLKALARPRWWRFGTWDRRYRLACTIGVLVFAVAFAGAGALQLLRGDDPPAQQALPLPPQRKAVLVRDAAEQPYVTEVVKEALRRAGYQPDDQVQGAPSVLVGYDPDIRGELAVNGLTPVGDFPTRDILIVRDDQEGFPGQILVSEGFGQDVEDQILKHHKGLLIIRKPYEELKNQLIDGKAEAAIVPGDVEADGYTPSEALDDLLPERRIVVGAGSGLRSALEPAMDRLNKEGVRSSDDPQADAKAFVDLIYSHAPALASSAKPVSEPAGNSGDVILITSVVAAVAGLAGALLLVRRPSRFKGSLTGRHRA